MQSRCFVLWLACASYFALGNYYWSHDPSFNDVRANVSDRFYESFMVRSRTLECATSCSNRPWCNSFFYSDVTSKCFLHSLVFNRDSNLSLVVSSGSKYYTFQSKLCPGSSGLIYDRLSELCWKLMMVPMAWVKANDSCSSNKMRMISLNTKAKMDFVIRTLNANPALSALSTSAKFHIGARRPLQMWNLTDWPSGIPDFYWMTEEWVNTTADREYWEVGQPNNAGKDEYSLAIVFFSKGNFLLNDRQSSKLFYYICEKLIQ